VKLARPRGPGCRANVFVASNTPQYAAMLKRSQGKDADPLDWRHDAERGGIWVVLGWFEKAPRFAGTFTRPSEPMREAAE
jgi:hypothetical protein